LADKRRSIFWLALPTSIYHTAHFLICQYAHAKALNWTRAYVVSKFMLEFWALYEEIELTGQNQQQE
jgi:hypothetical protein